jgi:hypothetical protein
MPTSSSRSAQASGMLRSSGRRLGDWRVAAVLAVATTLASCVGQIMGATGTLRITVSTTLTGQFDTMPDTYTAFVEDQVASNNREERSISANGSVDFSDLGLGILIRIGVMDLSPGCRATGSAGRAYEIVLSESTSEEVIPITCWMGSVNVRVETSGQSLDPDGYEVVLDGDRTLSVAPGVLGQTVVDRVPWGGHAVELVGVAPNCTTTPSLQTVQLSPSTGDLAITFTVTCVPPGSLPMTVFEDGFTDGSLWSAEIGWATNSPASTVEMRPTGGIPGGYRRMQHIFTNGGSIGVDHWYEGGTYTPSVDGAIQLINYRVSRIQFDPPFATAAIGDVFIVEQNGVRYWVPVDGGTTFTNLTWMDADALALTQDTFSPAGLDFSETGGEIRFGFARSNSSNGATITTTHGIDNWRVEVVR